MSGADRRVRPGRIFTAAVVCAAATAAAYWAGRSSLPAPPVSPGSWPRWWERVGPLTALFALARLGIVLVGSSVAAGLLLISSVVATGRGGRLAAALIRRSGRPATRLVLWATVSSVPLAACASSSGHLVGSSASASPTGPAPVPAPVLIGPAPAASATPISTPPVSTTPVTAAHQSFRAGPGRAPTSDTRPTRPRQADAGTSPGRRERHRPAGPSPPPPAGTVPAAVAPAPVPASWTVRPGDCLWSIAESVTAQTGHSRQVASYWARLVEANRDVVADPDLIFAGQVLVLPPLQPDSGVGSP